jgi:uncharacterized membrane protein HdeD (DUF308 family)
MAIFSAIRSMAEHWWVLLLRGLLAILFGILAFTWPGLTVLLLVAIWGAYAFVDGVLALVAGIKGKWTSLVVLGLLGIAAGLVAFFRPGLAAEALLWVLAFWAIAAGVMQIAAAVRLRREIEGEWLWILTGVLTVGLGVLLFLYPGAGVLTVTWMIATLAVVWGILLVMLAFKVKRLKGHAAPAAA